MASPPYELGALGKHPASVSHGSAFHEVPVRVKLENKHEHLAQSRYSGQEKLTSPGGRGRASSSGPSSRNERWACVCFPSGKSPPGQTQLLERSAQNGLSGGIAAVYPQSLQRGQTRATLHSNHTTLFLGIRPPCAWHFSEPPARDGKHGEFDHLGKAMPWLTSVRT